MVVVVVVLFGLLATRTAHALGPASLRDCGTASRRLLDPAAPLELVVVVAGDDDRDVRRALADPEVATAGTRLAPLPRRAFVGVRDGHEELFGGELVVVLGVRDRGLEHLEHVVGRVLLAELQRALGVVDREAADEVEDLTDLVRRHGLVARGGTRVRRVDDGSHQRRLDRSCPAWYRNVRVGANSPSL